MLAIRLQRRGRKGQAQFRVIVQDSRFSPKSGRVVENLGPYDPHTKVAKIDTEAAKKYLANGARPSERVARILKAEGVKLPEWVKDAKVKEGTLRNPEKLRKNQPKEEEESVEEAPAEEVKEETPEEEPSAEEPKEEKPVEEAPAEEVKEETPEEEKAE